MTPESLDKNLFGLLLGELESISVRQDLPGDPLMPHSPSLLPEVVRATNTH